ncbi:G protein-regulated inducer of neurite outgrowth 1-like [Haliotis cracherodii]|uniref:G protein-regulated inducer of neurite outgrowth 1-like n=1 Tax=Haliotis cracherodii TaxID=6455 RepID=UPI0039EA8562
MEEDVTDRLVKGRMDREVDGRMDSQVSGKMNRQVDERIDGQADGRMDRGVAGRIDTQVDGKMDRQVDERIDGQADGRMDRGVAGRIDTQVDGKIDRQVDERIDGQADGRMDRGVAGRIDTQDGKLNSQVDERMDGQADGWMDRGVAGRIDTQVDGKMDSPVDERMDGQADGCMDRGVAGRINTQVAGKQDRPMDRNTGVDVGEMNSSATSSGPINQHMDSKIINSVGSETGEKANVSVEVEKDSTEKPVCVSGDQAELDNSGDGLGRKTMKRKSEESITLGYVGPSEGEAKKIKMGRCTTGEMVGSVGTVCQSRSDVSNTQGMGVSIPHLEVQSLGSRDSEGETDESKVASDRKTGFVLPGKQTLCNQVKGSLIPMSVKSRDRHLNKTHHKIVKENRNCNSNNTAETTYGLPLGNHCDKGIMSATVGDVGSLPSVVASLKASTVAPGPKEVMGLSPQEQGTEKEKDMSLISPPHTHPMKTITTPPQKLQADNLPASAVLSPGSTVASSDVFPVSCRELVRRMVERDAREKQSRKDNGLLQKEAPSDYIAVPVGRIEDFSENLQLKDVEEKTNRAVNTQTPTFVQPQVPRAPRPVATSKMADLPTLVENGVLTPGKGVLSVRAKGKVFQASLSSTGHIIGSGGEVFRTPKSWCQAVTGAVTVKKLQSYNMVLYKGHPLSSFVVEGTESSGHKEIRSQTDCYGKPVVSSITRSPMTTDKSTSLPRQSSGVSSTTIAANKVRTRPLTHSSTKSLAKRTGTTHPKTSPAANRQTGITLPVPLPVTQTNKSSVANDEEMVVKGNKETSTSMSELLRVLWRCTIKLIDDAEIVRCPEMDSTFWMTNFKDIRLSDSLWDSVDSWK